MSKELQTTNRLEVLSSKAHRNKNTIRYNPEDPEQRDLVTLRDVWVAKTGILLEMSFNMYRKKVGTADIFGAGDLEHVTLTAQGVSSKLMKYAAQKGELDVYSVGSNLHYYRRKFVIKFVDKVLSGKMQFTTKKEK